MKVYNFTKHTNGTKTDMTQMNINIKMFRINIWNLDALLTIKE